MKWFKIQFNRIKKRGSRVRQIWALGFRAQVSFLSVTWDGSRYKGLSRVSGDW